MGICRSIILFLLLGLLSGCTLFRSNPLDQNRGAVVLVFDTRTAGNLKSLRETLSNYDACATFFASGQITRGRALTVADLRADGHEVGLSGLQGVDPQSYSSMYGLQKYFQDEILTQVLDARRLDFDPHYYLLRYPTKMRAEALKLAPFLVSKGFTRVVDLMPDHISPISDTASSLGRSPVVHAYAMKSNAFDRVQIAALAKRNEVLVVAPDIQVLPVLLEEVRAQGIPFATVRDLER